MPPTSLSSAPFAIKAQDISKNYTIYHNQVKHSTLAESVAHRIRQPIQRPSMEIFRALQNVSFEVKKGEVIGLIGRNGAGKSTLLKVLSRITTPTTGQVQVFGRIGSLLEVGTGFHPELTGRENIFLNGAILGMRKREIERQFDAIVDFAGTEQFLDTPVKRYSSGMYIRLAFAVAAHLNSDILIVDEVLAVGDVQFQKKCMGKMQDITTHEGKTVLFVSHNMNAIATLTEQVLLLEAGQLSYYGDTSTALHKYQSALKDRYSVYTNPTTKHGIRRVCVNTSEANQIHNWGTPLEIEIDVALETAPRSASIGVQIIDETARTITGLSLNDSQQQWSQEGLVTLRATIEHPRLYAGDYALNVMVSDTTTRQSIDRVDGICHFQISMDLIPNEYGWKPGASVYIEEGHWQKLSPQITS